MLNEIIFFILVQISFVVGILFGKNFFHASSQQHQNDAFALKKQQQHTNKMMEVKIDTARFVTKVNDDTFAKNDKELGKSTSVDDDIGLSVSRLAQLKKNK